MRPDHAVLIEQRELALHLQHALDHEHHVGAAGVVFVEHQRHRMLDRPGQNPFAEFGDLLAFLQHDRVLADEIDAADVAVEVHAHHRPVQPCGHLFDMRRLAGAVIALDQNAPVVRKAGQDRQRGLAVEHIGRIQVGHIFVRLGKGRHRHGHVQAERVAHVEHKVGRGGWIKAGLRTHLLLPSIVSRPWRRFGSAKPRNQTLNAQYSHEFCRPEMPVGLDDLLQPLFGAPVAAIGVGVKALHKFLIPRLDLVQGCAFFEV